MKPKEVLLQAFPLSPVPNRAFFSPSLSDPSPFDACHAGYQATAALCSMPLVMVIVLDKTQSSQNTLLAICFDERFTKEWMYSDFQVWTIRYLSVLATIACVCVWFFFLFCCFPITLYSILLMLIRSRPFSTQLWTLISTEQATCKSRPAALVSLCENHHSITFQVSS